MEGLGLDGIEVPEGDASGRAVIAVVRDECQQRDLTRCGAKSIGVVLARDDMGGPVVAVPLVKGGVLKAAFVVGRVGEVSVRRRDRLVEPDLPQIYGAPEA